MVSKPEVVISGIGGIFPKSLDLDDFKDVLYENINTSAAAKWASVDQDALNYSHNMPHHREKNFDSSFFGVHRNQTTYLDPMTRLMLEKIFEAVIDAGINPSDIRGQTIPCFIGSSINENDNFLFEPVKSGFGVTGQARAMMANRLSYWLNINGPSCSMSNSWTDGVNVLQNALEMIQSGLCDSAIVGASNCMICSSISKVLNNFGVLSKDGITRAFDEKSNGYSRGDGIVVLYLQRADLAKRNYATILYANVSYYGTRDDSYLSMKSDRILKFLEDSYQKSGVNPNDVEYLETYGCGLKQIDEAELDAVEKLYCKNRNKPLQIGSVKTNVGHCESASSLVSLIKIILAMETGVIPAQLFYETPNHNISALKNKNIEVVNKNKKWNGTIAAINSFGLSTNLGHMIIRSNKNIQKYIHHDVPMLVNFSTRTEDGIKEMIEVVKRQPSDPGYYKLIHDAFSKNISGHIYRGYLLKGQIEEKSEYAHYSGSKRPVWYVYSGMGSQWQTMGKDLMKFPIFAKAVNKCHEILKPKGLDLLKIITEDDPDIFENILNSFVGIAAIQIGLTDVLKHLGIVPDGMIGHSVGELGCAYADDCLTAEQMILSAYYRGIASLESNLTIGMMAAIGMGYNKLKSICPKTIDIACHNSKDSCTISGPTNEVKKFVELLKSQSIFAKLVNVSNIAYHSQYIRPAAPTLLAYLKKIILEPKTRSSKWISTSVPEKNWNTDLAKTVSAEYLTNNLLSSVLFEEGLPHIPNDAILIEIAPHGLLQAILKRALPEEVLNVALTKRNTNCLEFLFSSIGKLYNAGLNFNLSVLYPPVPLPVSRGTKSLCKLIHWEHSEEWENIFDFDYHRIMGEAQFSINLNTAKYEYLNKNNINGKILIPPTIYFDFLQNMLQVKTYKVITFNNIILHKHILTIPEAIINISIMILNSSGDFEITSSGDLIVSGRVTTEENYPKINPFGITKNSNSVDEKDFYLELNARGYNYSDDLKCVSSVNFNENGFSGKTIETNWEKALNGILQMHVFQIGELTNKILLPKFIREMVISSECFDNNSEYIVSFDKKTGNIISNNGIYLNGIKYENYIDSEYSLTVETNKYIKYIESQPQNIKEEFIKCLDIVKENINSKNILITELKNEFDSGCKTYIEERLNHIKIQVNFNTINKIDISQMTKSSLLIVNGSFINILPDILKYTNEFILLRLLNYQSVNISKEYTIISKFNDSKNVFYLLKKINKSPVKLLAINKNPLSFEDSRSWISELQSIMKNNNNRVFVALKSIPKEGIKKFVDEIKKEFIDYNNLRFLFILDSTAPDFSTNTDFYKSVFERDLIISVYKNGNWGNYTTIIKQTDLSESVVNNSIISAATDKEFSKVCNVNYLGLHVKDLTRNDDKNIPVEICAVDYTGVNNNGCNIMGIAKTDLNGCKLIPDPEFIWPVPAKWNLSDAATVPYAYTIAYYTLFEICKITKGDSVLIHAGCTAIGQAALHVAFNYGCNVYTTVATDQQKSIIKQLLPGISDECVMSSENCNFELQVLWQTKGKGVDVVLNCLPGARLHASKRCLTTFGRLIQLGLLDAQEYKTTGMNIFLKCTSFHGVRVDKIFNQNAQVKKRLHQMITKDIKTGIVKPISRKIFTENRIDHILRYLKSSKVAETAILKVNNINSNVLSDASKKSVVKFDSDALYLVYGDMKDLWLYLVEWLLKRGARKVLVTKITTNHQSLVNRYLSLLKNKYNAEIIVTNKTVSNVETAKQVIKESNKYGTLKEAFIFANDKNTPKDLSKNIDNALNLEKTNCRMVCFVGKNTDDPYIRSNGEIRNILWEKEYNLMDILRNMDVLLTKEDDLNVFVKNKTVVSRDNNKFEAESIFLPNNLKTVLQLGQSNCQSIVQMTSNSSKIIRDVDPIFIIPGLSGIYCPNLNKFVSQLLYPIFAVNILGMELNNNTASYFADEILKQRKLNTYNLIGVTWGGLLAIEIAKELEKRGANVFLQILDGAPKMLQGFTSVFNKSGNFNMDLLKQIIKIGDSKSIEDVLKNTDNSLSNNDYKNIEKSLQVLQKLIEYSNSYKPLSNKINGKAIIFCSEDCYKEDTYNMTEHCLEIRYKLLKENHRNIYEDIKIIEFINDNVIMDNCFN